MLTVDSKSVGREMVREKKDVKENTEYRDDEA